MGREVKVGIMGDFDSKKASHPATNNAIAHAAHRLAVRAEITWLPTTSLLTEQAQQILSEFDCLWASSGAPYESMDGMIRGIQVARQLGKPFIGT